MADAAKLIRKYNTDLMSDSLIRSLMSSVAQDAQNETISFAESVPRLRKIVSETSRDTLQTARRSIIGYLNDVYFTSRAVPLEWWFEMHTRLQKLCVVSMVLEGLNLRSFGAKPEESDIPQALVGIMLKVLEIQPQLPRLRRQHLEAVKQLPSDYVNCYLQNKY